MQPSSCRGTLTFRIIRQQRNLTKCQEPMLSLRLVPRPATSPGRQTPRSSQVTTRRCLLRRPGLGLILGLTVGFSQSVPDQPFLSSPKRRRRRIKHRFLHKTVTTFCHKHRTKTDLRTRKGR